MRCVYLLDTVGCRYSSILVTFTHPFAYFNLFACYFVFFSFRLCLLLLLVDDGIVVVGSMSLPGIPLDNNIVFLLAVFIN